MIINAFSLPILLSVIISLIFTIWAYTFHRVIGTLSFCFLMLGAFLYSFGYLMEISIPSLSWHLLWLKVQYIGIVSIPFFWVIFTMKITGRGRLISVPLITVLLSIPIIVLSLVLSIDKHDLFYQNITLVTVGPFSTISFTRGLFYWIFVVHQNALFLFSVILLLTAINNSEGKQRRVFLILLLGLTIPWLSHLVYLTGKIPRNLDIVPLFFAVTGVVFYIGLFNFKLLTFLPVAKSYIFDHLPYTILIVDRERKLRGMNRSAMKMLNLSPDDVGIDFERALRRVRVSSDKVSGELKAEYHKTFLDKIIYHIDEAVNQRSLNDFEELISRWGDINKDNSDNMTSYDNGSILFNSTIPLELVSTVKRKTFWYKIESTILTDSTQKSQLNGKSKRILPEGIIITIRDVTEKVESEEDLTRLATAIEHIKEAIVITDSQARIIYVNKAFEAITGYKKNEILGENPRLLKSGEQTAEFYEDMWRQLSKGWTWQGHFVNRKKSGALYTEEAAISPIFDNQGKIMNYVAVKRDISDFLLIQEEVDRFISAIDQTDEMIIIFDPEGLVQYVNPAFTETSGIAREKAILKQVEQFITDKKNPDLMKEIWQSLSGGNAWQGIYITAKETGETVTIEASISPVYNAKERIVSYVAVGTDITERIRVERELQESKNRYDQLAEQSRTYHWEIDNKGMYTFMSPMVEKVLGYKPEELVGKRYFFDLTPDPDRDSLKEEVFSLIKDRNPIYNYENRVKLKIGNYIWVTTNGMPLLDDNGKVIGYRGSDADITKRKVSQEKLRESEEKYRAIAETTFVGIAMIDKVLNITYANEAFALLLETERETMINKKLEDVIGIQAFENISGILSGMTSPAGESFETIMETQSGKRINVLISLSPLFSDKGEIQGFIGIHIDITERLAALNAIKESAQLKANFASMVSHELKIPLTVIKEGIALLYDGTADEVNNDQKNLLGNVQDNVSRLSRLINDVLDYQKIEAGKFAYNFTENDINEVVTETVESMKTVISKKGLTVSLKLHDHLPLIEFDRDRIIQVLVNIIGNSVRFTETGGITVKTEMSSDLKAVKIAVRDTGCGISDEHIPRVFEGFYNISHEGRHHAGGTGLGLLISKQIIEDHNGLISLSSKKGESTEVIFSLPVSAKYLS
jgi:PAS domain S-box-containing protein